MKRILVTTDLSKEAESAFALACTLAKQSSAEVLLLAIIEDPTQAAMIYALDNPVLPGPEVQEQLLQKVNRDLEAIGEKFFPSVSTSYHVVESVGPVHSAIIDFAKAKKVDLVVIATHGRTGLKRLLIGSVAERVVRECPCPILTVPSRESDLG